MDDENKEFKYQCHDCKKETRLKPRDPVRCSICGSRILYKLRTTKCLQYDAI